MKPIHKEHTKMYWRKFVAESDDLSGSYIDSFYKSSFVQFSFKSLGCLMNSWIDAGKSEAECQYILQKIRTSASLITVGSDPHYDLFQKNILRESSAALKNGSNDKLVLQLLQFDLHQCFVKLRIKQCLHFDENTSCRNLHNLKAYFLQSKKSGKLISFLNQMIETPISIMGTTLSIYLSSAFVQFKQELSETLLYSSTERRLNEDLNSMISEKNDRTRLSDDHQQFQQITEKEDVQVGPSKEIVSKLVEENLHLYKIIKHFQDYFENTDKKQENLSFERTAKQEEQNQNICPLVVSFTSIPPYSQIGLLVFGVLSKQPKFKKNRLIPIKITKQQFCRIFDSLMEHFGIWNNTRTLLENRGTDCKPHREIIRYLKDDHTLYQEIVQTLSSYQFIKIFFESKRNHKAIDFSLHCKNRKLSPEICAADPEQYEEYLQLTRSIDSIREAISASNTPMKQTFLDAFETKDTSMKIIENSLKVSPQKITKEILLNETRKLYLLSGDVENQ